MAEYDVEYMRTMTVANIIELNESDDDDSYDKIKDALANIDLYLYSNIDIIDDFEIEDSEISSDGRYRASLHFTAICEDYPIIQCDADDFIEQTVSGNFDDMIEIDVTPEMTLMDVAEKMKDQIEIEADRVIENAAESAAEDYGPHRSYWWTR